MTKQKLLLLFIAISTILNSTKAQSYTIESFEGVKTKIHVTETSSWYQLAVSCLTDTLFLNDYAGIKQIHVLKGKFLEIVYDGRGGTGSDVSNTIILSVNKNKINVSMLVYSFAKWFAVDVDENLYTLKFNLTGNNKSDYKLIINVHNQQKSSDHPKLNYNKYEQVILNYDPNQNIFYSSHKSITHSFTINAPKMQQPEKRDINETLPIIFFGKNDIYYFIKGEWYHLGDYDTLYGEYYKNHL